MGAKIELTLKAGLQSLLRAESPGQDQWPVAAPSPCFARRDMCNQGKVRRRLQSSISGLGGGMICTSLSLPHILGRCQPACILPVSKLPGTWRGKLRAITEPPLRVGGGGAGERGQGVESATAATRSSLGGDSGLTHWDVAVRAVKCTCSDTKRFDH